MKRIDIQEDIRLSGSDIVLEKGDTVYVVEKTVTVSKPFGGNEELEVYDSVPRGWNLWVGFEKEGFVGIGFAGDNSNPYQFTKVGVLSQKFASDELKTLQRTMTLCGFRRPEQYERLKGLKKFSLPRYQNLLDSAYELMTDKIKWQR